MPWDLRLRRSDIVLLFGGVGIDLGKGEEEEGEKGGASESDAFAGHELARLGVVVNDRGRGKRVRVGV